MTQATCLFLATSIPQKRVYPLGVGVQAVSFMEVPFRTTDRGVPAPVQTATSFVIRSVLRFQIGASHQLIRGRLDKARAQQSVVRGLCLKEATAARALIVPSCPNAITS